MCHTWHFYSERKWAVSCECRNLIGSGSGRNFPILPTVNGFLAWLWVYFASVWAKSLLMQRRLVNFWYTQTFYLLSLRALKLLEARQNIDKFVWGGGWLPPILSSVFWFWLFHFIAVFLFSLWSSVFIRIREFTIPPNLPTGIPSNWRAWIRSSWWTIRKTFCIPRGAWALKVWSMFMVKHCCIPQFSSKSSRLKELWFSRFPKNDGKKDCALSKSAEMRETRLKLPSILECVRVMGQSSRNPGSWRWRNGVIMQKMPRERRRKFVLESPASRKGWRSASCQAAIRNYHSNIRIESQCKVHLPT